MAATAPARKTLRRRSRTVFPGASANSVRPTSGVRSQTTCGPWSAGGFFVPENKALGDPIRLQLVDVLRKHAGKVCVCELVPLFDISQPTLSHHLKKLRDARIVDSERRGLWAYYYVNPEALEELSAWLS